MRGLILALCLLPSPVAAEVCASLWLTRNMVFDRSGHCFTSPLGRAVFDNAGCSGSVQLSEDDRAYVETIQDLERRFQCEIDPSQTQLDLPRLAHWLRLNDLPIRDDIESACIGYLGTRTPLRAGASPESPIIAWIETGDSVLYGHLNRGEWEFVTTSVDFVPKALGWTRARIFMEGGCEMAAG